MIDQQLLDLAADVGKALRPNGLRLATAESCTGGLIGHLMTEIAGSSDYYHGGVIAYDNAVKREVLGVELATLEQYGAVSEECAREMAGGVRRLLGTQVSLATTGIAGPGGGSAQKPVGLVYIALATSDGVRVERCLFQGDRSRIKAETARRGLQMVLEALAV